MKHVQLGMNFWGGAIRKNIYFKNDTFKSNNVLGYNVSYTKVIHKLMVYLESHYIHNNKTY